MNFDYVLITVLALAINRLKNVKIIKWPALWQVSHPFPTLRYPWMGLLFDRQQGVYKLLHIVLLSL